MLDPLVPPTMLGKFRLAFGLFFRHVALYAALVLFIWLPANLMINYYRSRVDDPKASADLILLSLTVQLVFSPIIAASILYASDRLLAGDRVAFFDAISQGMNHWIPLFMARMTAQVLIALGLLAFIIPGVVLSIRWALLDSVVVFEQQREPRSRSYALVTGKEWQILGASVLFQAVLLAIGGAFEIVLDHMPSIDNMWFRTILDCSICVLVSVYGILLYLYYRESMDAEQRASAA